eukprot:TRINITY_DN5173_c0_g1_i1.p1 TRINITY_DN5173_c0_g1~~TRINITY_DN5173_c0_g1_i1.p1  ORF type:complete len:178 (+),score=30.50 TRINITY_DN5173_c0_g1_i1:54-587(+)
MPPLTTPPSVSSTSQYSVPPPVRSRTGAVQTPVPAEGDSEIAELCAFARDLAARSSATRARLEQQRQRRKHRSSGLPTPAPSGVDLRAAVAALQDGAGSGSLLTAEQMAHVREVAGLPYGADPGALPLYPQTPAVQPPAPSAARRIAACWDVTEQPPAEPPSIAREWMSAVASARRM